jgi:hypothetical protein
MENPLRFVLDPEHFQCVHCKSRVCIIELYRRNERIPFNRILLQKLNINWSGKARTLRADVREKQKTCSFMRTVLNLIPLNSSKNNLQGVVSKGIQSTVKGSRLGLKLSFDTRFGNQPSLLSCPSIYRLVTAPELLYRFRSNSIW